MATKIEKKIEPKALLPKEMADSTREQQEAHVLCVGRTCTGKLMYSPEDEKKNWKAWYALTAKENEAGVLRMIAKLLKAAQKLAAPGFRVTAPPPPEEEGNWFRLRQIAFPLIRLEGPRVGFPCGWDQNEAVLAAEFDGKDHEANCPSCGRPFLWTAPVFY